MYKILFSLVLISFSVHAQSNIKNPKGIEKSELDAIIEDDNYAKPAQHKKFNFEVNKVKQGIYTYTPNKKGDGFDGNLSKRNPFVYNDYKYIYRFDALTFEDENELSDEAEKTFESILSKLNEIQKNKDNEYIVSIIGHTREVDNTKEDIELDTGYTDFFQSIAQYNKPKENEASKKSKNYAKYIYEKLIESKIKKEYLYQENVEGSDPLYSENDEEARELNERVEVTIYLKKFVDIDSDKDGVFDLQDYCPDTVRGARVDVNGCPFILTLDLRFSFDNDTFEDKASYDNVLELAAFMKKYPVYKATIVGHTDSIGKAAYNKKLSKRRATLVVQTLVEQGVLSLRLSSDGRGESEPLFSNDTKEGRYKNRRTEVELFLPQRKKKHEIKLRKRGEVY